MGGAKLSKNGMELTVDARTTASVMGFTEVVGKLGQLYKAFWKLLDEVDERKPKVAVLVDFPDFNLRMARKLHERGIKVVYFISPQLWAWRRGRIELMKKYVDKILPIFPFEEDFYRDKGVSAKYVGHPYTDEVLDSVNRNEFLINNGIEQKSKIVAFLPGSRKAEIIKNLPIMLESIEILANKHPDLCFVIPVAHSVSEIVSVYKKDIKGVSFIEGQAKELLHVANAGVIASGTATIEAALSGIPFCICYRVSKLTYLIGKLLIRGVKFIGMPNLIANREIVREFVQDKFDPSSIANEVERLVFDDKYRKQIMEDLAAVKAKLETGDLTSVAEKVAKEIYSEIQAVHITQLQAQA